MRSAARVAPSVAPWRRAAGVPARTSAGGLLARPARRPRAPLRGSSADPRVRAAPGDAEAASEAASEASEAPSSSASPARITRAEALRRTDAVLAASPSLAATLDALAEAAALARLPPARCVWAPKLWAHASRRWTLPELLAACKALDGASFPELLRLCAANASITTALGLFREGRALGWCDRDGGASLVAMARAHDALGQGKAADALWAEAHEMARAGEIDVDAVRAAAGVPRRVGRSRRRNASSSSSRGDDAAKKNKTFSPREQRFEVYAAELASASRRRRRAACRAYVRLRDGDGDWPGREALPANRRAFPRRVFTAAARAAAAAKDAGLARRVARDMRADGVAPDAFLAASLASAIGAGGRAEDADLALEVFESARESARRSPRGAPGGRRRRPPKRGKNPGGDGRDSEEEGDLVDLGLGGAAWSCAIGAACRAGRVDAARTLLCEMRDEPFLRVWPSCPAAGVDDETLSGDRDEAESDLETSSNASSGSSSKAARYAASERRAAAPAYAQVMHALCDAGRPAEALETHREMLDAGFYPPANPPHYKALFKAFLGAGTLGKDARAMTPREALAAASADAVLAVRAKHEAEKASERMMTRPKGGARENFYGKARRVRSEREATATPSRGMATAMALGRGDLAAEAIRATLQVAAAGGFPDVASEARARLRWAKCAAEPRDLELTLEAYERAGDARGAIAHWNANRRALTAELEARLTARSAADDDAEEGGSNPAPPPPSLIWEVGSDGVVVSGCEPTPRAWTAAIKAHCALDEPLEAAALLEEAVDAYQSSGASQSASARRKPPFAAPGYKPPFLGARAGPWSADPGGKRAGRGRDAAPRAPEPIAFNLVAAAFARAGAPRRAEDILWLMDAAGVRPNEATYNTVIAAYADAARPAKVSEARRASASTRGLAVSFGGVSPGFEHDAALDTSFRPPPRVSNASSSSFSSSSSSSSSAPDEAFDEDPSASSDEDPADAALRVLREMRDASARGVAPAPGARAWTSALAASARAADAEGAVATFDAMRERGGVEPGVRAWTALMSAHANAGDHDACVATYWRMRDAGVAPDEATLAAALKLGLRPGGVGGKRAERAVAVYKDMRALRVRPNNAGFRALTGMWVDRAFDRPESEDEDSSYESEDSSYEDEDSSSSSAALPPAPNFMLGEWFSGRDDVDAFDFGAGSKIEPAPGAALLDVHGLSTVETRAAVLSVLQALRERRRAGLPVRGDFVVVVGRGGEDVPGRAASKSARGSGNAAGTLRDAVRGLARDLRLEMRAARGNAGRLVAKEEELLRWLDKRTRVEGRAKKKRAATRDGASAARAGDVPGLEVALREWLEQNE